MNAGTTNMKSQECNRIACQRMKVVSVEISVRHRRERRDLDNRSIHLSVCLFLVNFLLINPATILRAGESLRKVSSVGHGRLGIAAGMTFNFGDGDR